MSNLSAFRPSWSGAVEEFISERELEDHYEKHVVREQCWGWNITREEYMQRACEVLNCVDEDRVIELRQVRVTACVKYDFLGGELGVACDRTGLIRTFFVPSDPRKAVLHKLEIGDWVPMVGSFNPAVAAQFYQFLGNVDRLKKLEEWAGKFSSGVNNVYRKTPRPLRPPAWVPGQLAALNNEVAALGQVSLSVSQQARLMHVSEVLQGVEKMVSGKRAALMP